MLQSLLSSSPRLSFTEAARPRRVLYIAYTFPPTGGAGVQRTAKFVKYLPQHNWLPTVLTVSNPSVPARDESLLADIPADLPVWRVKTLEPGYAMKSALAGESKTNGGKSLLRSAKSLAAGLARNTVKTFLQPDPQILWMPAAIREGKRLLAQNQFDAILVSGPPFSSFLIGEKLSRHSGVPLILDYRDEWDISNAYLENRRLGSVSLWRQRNMQHRVIRQAAALIATTQHSCAALEKIRVRCNSAARIACIYNGYDPADFPPRPPAPPRPRYRVSYVGTLWNLTSVHPLAEAVRKLSQDSPQLAAHLELTFVGRRLPQQQALLAQLADLPCTLVEHPYLPHKQALNLLHESDALVALLSDLPGAQRVVPAKLFEYMAAARTILAIAPRGEMWHLLKHYPAARLHTPPDIAGIAASLANEIRHFIKNGPRASVHFDVSEHSRPHQAAQLADLLNSVCLAPVGGLK